MKKIFLLFFILIFSCKKEKVFLKKANIKKISSEKYFLIRDTLKKDTAISIIKKAKKNRKSHFKNIKYPILLYVDMSMSESYTYKLDTVFNEIGEFWSMHSHTINNPDQTHGLYFSKLPTKKLGIEYINYINNELENKIKKLNVSNYKRHYLNYE